MNKAFTQSFSTFLRRRRAKTHFERRPLLGSFTSAPAATPLVDGAAKAAPGPDLLAVSQLEPAQALARLQSQADGLDLAEAARRLVRDGPNDVAHEAPLLGMTLAIMAIGLWLPLSPLAGYFKLQALPAAFYVWLLAILLGYCTLTTLMKRVYVRRYGWQ